MPAGAVPRVLGAGCHIQDVEIQNLFVGRDIHIQGLQIQRSALQQAVVVLEVEGYAAEIVTQHHHVGEFQPQGVIHGHGVCHVENYRHQLDINDKFIRKRGRAALWVLRHR